MLEVDAKVLPVVIHTCPSNTGVACRVSFLVCVSSVHLVRTVVATSIRRPCAEIAADNCQDLLKENHLSNIVYSVYWADVLIPGCRNACL
jgi:hypothetical protein